MKTKDAFEFLESENFRIEKITTKDSPFIGPFARPNGDIAVVYIMNHGARDVDMDVRVLIQCAK